MKRKDKVHFAMAALISTASPSPEGPLFVRKATSSDTEAIDSQNMNVDPDGMTAMEPGTVEASPREITDVINIGVPVIISFEWDNQKARRFKMLAVKEALETITSQESKELELLDALRERSGFPPSADEVIRQYRQRRVTQELTQSLRRYVEFFQVPETTHSERRKA